MQDELLTTKEAAAILKVNEKTVRRMAADERLEAHRITGGQLRYWRSAVLAILEPEAGD